MLVSSAGESSGTNGIVPFTIVITAKHTQALILSCHTFVMCAFRL